MHYLLIPYTLLFFLIAVFSSNTKSNSGKGGLLFVVWLSMFLVGFIISFQDKIFGDAFRYYMGFLEYRELTFSEILVNNEGVEYGYLITNWIIGQFTLDRSFFFFILFIIVMIIFGKSLNIIYSFRDKINILSIYILYPYFLFYVANAKRQGLGLALMLLAIAYFYNRQKKLGYIALFVAPLFHTSMLLTVPVLFLYAQLKTKPLLVVANVVLFASLLLSVTGLNGIFLSPLQSFIGEDMDRYKMYFDDTLSYMAYETGFRLDFTLFSMFPLFLYIYYRKYIPKASPDRVHRWLALYMLLNSIYQFFSFMPFSDRFAAISWFIWPIVCYEILKSTNSNRRILYFIMVILISNLILLQTYTGVIFGKVGIF